MGGGKRQLMRQQIGGWGVGDEAADWGGQQMVGRGGEDR